MKNITVGISILLFYSQCLFSWGKTWLRVYNEFGAGKTGNSICQTNNGDFLIVGFGLYAVVKINSLGDIISSKYLNVQYGNYISSCYDGGCIFAGMREYQDKYNLFPPPPYNYTFEIYKISSEDSIQWHYYLTTQNYLGCSGWRAKQNYFGDYISFGKALENNLVKLNSSGSPVWASPAVFGAEGDIIETQDHGFLVLHKYISKFNTDGQLMWSDTYPNTMHFLDIEAFREQDNTVNYLIFGYIVNSSTDYDYLLMKIDSSGDSLWSRTYGGNYQDYGRSGAVVEDNSIVFIGYTNSSSGNGGYDVLLYKLNPAGDTIWRRTFGGTLDDYAQQVIYTYDSCYVFIGTTNSYTGDSRIWIGKLSPYGDINPYIDVGCIKITEPFPVFNPGTAEMELSLTNYGLDDKEISVHCEVFNKYNSLVFEAYDSLFLPSLDTAQVNFGSYNFCKGWYSLKFTLYVPGDVNSQNDTISKILFVNSYENSYWQTLPDIPIVEQQLGIALGYSKDSLDHYFIHAFTSNADTNHYIYDINLQTWSIAASQKLYQQFDPAHCTVNNRIYIIGSSSGTSTNIMSIYDALSDTFIYKILPRVVTHSPITVFKNRFIYIFGGQESNYITTAFIYDCLGDSFFSTILQLPDSCFACQSGAGIVGDDSVLIVGIYKPVFYQDKIYFGKIDSLDPTNIQWQKGSYKFFYSEWHRLGYANVNNFSVFIGGIGTGNEPSYYTLAYRANQGWIRLPDKPNSAWGNSCCCIQNENNPNYFEIYTLMLTAENPRVLNFDVLYLDKSTYIEEISNEIPRFLSCLLLSSNLIIEDFKIRIEFPYASDVRFRIFDITGRLIKDDIYSNLPEGVHILNCDMTDNRGNDVGTGQYFYHITVNEQMFSGKVLLLK